MFIVLENNPQLFSVKDGIKLFNKLDEAARYALNRGLSNPAAPTLDALKAQVDLPGKAITGGQTGFNVTLFNTVAVDGEVDDFTLAVNAERKKLEERVKALETELDTAKSELVTAVDAVTVELEKSEAKNAELEKKLALALAPAATPTPAETTEAPKAEAPAAAPKNSSKKQSEPKAETKAA